LLVARAGKDARQHLAVLAGVLALLAGAATLVASAHDQPPVPPTAPAVLTAPVKAQPKAATPLSASQPLRILIPKIGVSAPFVHLGLKPGGEMETPKDPDTVGWYTASPTPGALGPSIVAGHVTWNRKPSAFFRLGSLRPGDVVHIQRMDGRTAVFAVTKIATYQKDRFPTADVYGDVSNAELRLITCGGEYVETSHRYLANVVVYARLTDPR
jgi:LPXTG-site transpeptidase (sortase) family protein